MRRGGAGEKVLPNSRTNQQPHYPLSPSSVDPLQLVAAVGDPMQIVAAGMAIAASRSSGVLLAGGTQMLAVYALAQALAKQTHHRETVASLQGSDSLPFPCGASVVQAVTDIAIQDCLVWQPKQIVVGTTRWVVEDPTGDTVGLAQQIGNVPLLATELSFATSRYPQLQAYEQGYVKEGVGAGGCAIAAQLYKGWNFVQ